MKIIKRGVIEIDLDNSKVIMNKYHFNGEDENLILKDLQTIELELAMKEIKKILNANYKNETRPSIVYNNADYYF